ncbi:MAG: hypothetical protein ACI9ZH_000002 [Paracoccaceae bacterium]|jgi:hypothetical protein
MQRDSYAFVKPETPTIPNPAEADHLLDAIAEVVMSAVRKVTAAQTEGLNGHKILFEVNPGIVDGPYFYRHATRRAKSTR